ncbi:MAG: hypothetical protein JXA50_09650 [Deltaproteobacteria bacterium]|nr:hypothetical protein [Deltaproteobacteria bacterium]
MKTKMRTLGFLSVLFILPFLCGCPYESKVPLSGVSKATIDPALIGDWEHTDEEEPFTMIIQQFNEHEFLIMGIEEGEVQRDVMRGFVTVIEDERFLNVQDTDVPPDKRVWYLAKYTISGDTLTAWTVDDELFTKPVTSSRALYSFVKKHLNDKALFSDDPFLVLKRVGE